MALEFLTILDEKCRRCYRCVRECPTNALMIDHGRIRRIEKLCVLCGACLKNCPHNAVCVHTGVEEVLGAIEKGEKVIACLDPSFPAVLDRGTPGQLVTALKKLGFYEVWESAFAGELIVQAYKELLSQNGRSYISSFCPSVVLYIEKFAPELIDQLVPVVSPMMAAGMAVKRLRGQDVKVVFIGSCISQMLELSRLKDKNGIDYVLNYHDIPKILEGRGIEREKQQPSDFDGPRFSIGGILSIAGGLSQSIGYNMDLLNLDFLIAAGSERVMRAIRQYQDGIIHTKFLDFLFCKGCIDGPLIDKNISGPSRKEIVVNYVKEQLKKGSSTKCDERVDLDDLDIKIEFKAQNVSLPMPSEDEIEEVLTKLNKNYPDKNLDCGACGYDTCREKAIAVVKGLAEIEMCPPYLLEQCRAYYSRLEKSHQKLKLSHEKLEQAQKQLIQTEKMASLGQLAAGIAHELNNPLGTITMFAHIIRKQLTDNEKLSGDIDLIVKEAERAAKIVKDLLSFSRETKVKPGLVNINNVIEEALSLLVHQSLFDNIKIDKKLDPSVPTIFADADLLKQVVFNIILNGAQAMDGDGVLTLTSKSKEKGEGVEIQISDTGKGISKQHLSKLFDPFFTTKEKGTGLGLAIAYGIVSKHKGNIHVKSELGKGTTFTITLPVLSKDQWSKIEHESLQTNETQGGEGELQSQDLIG